MDRSRAAGMLVNGPPWLDLQLTPSALIEAPRPDLVPSFQSPKRAKLGRWRTHPTSRRQLGRDAPGGPWLWVHCRNVARMHRVPMVLTPLIIRWGADASNDWLRKSARWLLVAPRQLTLEHAPAARSREGFSSHSCSRYCMVVSRGSWNWHRRAIRFAGSRDGTVNMGSGGRLFAGPIGSQASRSRLGSSLSFNV